MSASGKTVLLRIAGEEDPVLIPTRQLQVHYERDLGETSKIIRPVAAPATSSRVPATAAAVAVV